MTKYEEYNKLLTDLSQKNASDDYWYDLGIEEATSLLEKFTEKDWSELEKNIYDKTLEWQKKAVYSFEQQDNQVELRIILSLIEVSDVELFEMCVDSLRFKINETNKKTIMKNINLMNRLKDGASADTIMGKLCKDLLKKILDE